jgi:hypothetical protein
VLDVQWPPQLADVKRDLSIPDTDTRDDAAIADDLAAAIAWVGERKADATGLYVPGPDASDVALGTARLAARWFARRRSPDGTVAMGDLGTVTIPGFDSDIERLLSLGRYGPSLIV